MENVSSPLPSFNENKGHVNTIYASFLPGITYFVNPKLGIEGTFGKLAYSYSSSKLYPNPGNGISKNANLGLDLGLSSISLGAHYYFGSKPKPKADVDKE